MRGHPNFAMEFGSEVQGVTQERPASTVTIERDGAARDAAAAAS